MKTRKNGFTFIELMVVFAIIGLLAAMMLPGFFKARDRARAQQAMYDVRLYNSYITVRVTENGLQKGEPVDTNSFAVALQERWHPLDPLSRPYIFGRVGDHQVSVSQKTKDELAYVGIDWGEF